MRVVGAFVVGTTSSSGAEAELSGEIERDDISGRGGGSANSESIHDVDIISTFPQGVDSIPSETGRNSTSCQPVPSSGVSIHTYSKPSNLLTSTA